MRYLLAGGGTGGHIYPALTIAESLREIDPDATFLYVGTARGRESEVVPQAGLPFETVTSGGFVNLGLAEKIAGVARVARGVGEATSIVSRFRPDIIIGTGGFVCGPIYLAALLKRRPLVIQEQNAFPGVANRIAARWARAVFVPFEEARAIFPRGARLHLAGNPVRREVTRADGMEGRRAYGFDPADQVLLISGGSGGARDFNLAVVRAVQQLLPERPRLQVLHMTGERYHQQVLEAYGGPIERVRVVPYIHNMPDAMAAAELGIFRAGAMTLAEVAVRGLPSILIPSPNVTHNHQEWNARSFEQKGAAVVLPEADLAEGALAQSAAALLDDQSRRAAIRQALLAVAEPEASRRIAEMIARIARGKQ